jgi:hypothetical protein
MKVKSKTTLVLLLIAGLPLLAGAVFFIYKAFAPSSRQAIEAVPADASVIFITDNPGGVWKKLSTESSIWSTLVKTENFRRLGNTVRIIDSAIRKHSDLDKMLKGKRLLISLHNPKPNENEFLFLLELPPAFLNIGGKHVLEKYGQAKLTEEKELNGVNCRRVLFGNTGVTLWYAFYRGLFMASYNAQLLANSIKQSDSQGFLENDDGFKKLNALAGKNVDANLYIHFSKFPGVLNEFSAKGFSPGFSRLSNFARWSQLDLFVGQKKIMLGGYTLASGSDFLKLFKNQEPMVPTALNLLPAQTASFIYLCFKDFSSFVGNYNNYLSQTSKNTPSGTKLLDVSTAENLKEAAISEIAVALVNGEMPTAAANSFVIIHSLSPEKLDRMLDETLPDEAAKAITIQDKELMKCGFSKFFDNFFFNIFPEFDTTYYYAVGEYFIFCPSPENLDRFVVNYISGNTLVNDRGFGEMSNSLSQKSNILLYYNPSRAASFHHFLFKNEMAGKFDSNLPALDALEGVALQFSGGGDLIYTTMLVQNKEAQSEAAKTSDLPEIAPEETDSLSTESITSGPSDHIADSLPSTQWMAVLDAPMVGKPWFIPGNKNDNGILVAFDSKASMYIISMDGEIEQKLSLTELPASELFGSKSGSNKGSTFFFSTQTKLHQYSFSGKPVKGFPISLNEKASNGISVYYPPKGADAKIFYAGESNSIYCIDKTGKSVKNWLKPKANDQVIQPIRFLNTKEGTHVIIPQKNGKVLITNLKGEVKLSTGDSFANAANSEFYINETNKKSLLLTTDNKGNLVYLSAKGPVEKTVFDNFSKNHFFVYDDFDGNNQPDFIYLDGTTLVVYDKLRKVLLQHQFSKTIRHAPVMIKYPGIGNLIGVFSQSTNQLFILSREGLFLEHPLLASTPFVVLNNATNEGPLVVAGFKSALICYKLTNTNPGEE